MTASWRFVAGLAAGFILSLGLTAMAFYLNLGVPCSELSRWTFEINQKKRSLAEQAPSPKLLLVGGSATLFGISAKEIQEQTGFPTINLGTHAALGTTYILHLAEQAAKPGDIVLLALEYELYTSGKMTPAWADALAVDYIVSRDPAWLRSLSLREQWSVFMLTSAPRLVRGLKSRWGLARPGGDPGIYSVRSLNECGDQINHPKAARPARRDQILQVKSLLGRGLPAHPAGFPAIEAFVRWAQARQIRVLATFPNLCDQPDYHGVVGRQTAKAIEDFFARLNVPVVGEYTDAALPPDEFFDTMYHLTDEAELGRSQRLAAQLKPYLKTPGGR